MAEASIEQWGVFEAGLAGPQEGNPFTEVELAATFTQGDRAVKVRGFYDGQGVYKVRFMPDSPGEWRYRTESNRPSLDGRCGEFRCCAPSAGNHGPVRVAQTFHFAHADGTPYRPLGTTCYMWTQAPADRQAQTLQTLRGSPFNKLRMCVLPKRGYVPREDSATAYPFEGRPQAWDFTRPVPAWFANFERCVAELGKLGVEADVILYHPYDEGVLGLDRIHGADEDRYVRYLVARLAAYRNVWWSLANEYDFIETKTEADWDRLFQIIQAEDPYGHLRSIHNGRVLYNCTLPWVTHASLQIGSAVADFGRAELLRDAYRKPVIYDEVKYEGALGKRWGNLTAEELVCRFWFGTIGGTYVTHGEVVGSSRATPAWTGLGGELRGQSPPRLAFLRAVLDGAPGPIEPIDKWQDLRTAGVAGKYYLVYFGREAPTEWAFELPEAGLTEGQTFRAEVLDTWNMTVQPVEGVFSLRAIGEYRFADAAGRRIPLPGRPYVAVRITRAD
ncbi:MAG: DUF5060 domain-containing protein [Phycisphaerae bacterium]|nr:DUF5060 domain-containing protein [Phycisphaerae bacterium]